MNPRDRRSSRRRDRGLVATDSLAMVCYCHDVVTICVNRAGWLSHVLRYRAEELCYGVGKAAQIN